MYLCVFRNISDSWTTLKSDAESGDTASQKQCFGIGKMLILGFVYVKSCPIFLKIRNVRL